MDTTPRTVREKNPPKCEYRHSSTLSLTSVLDGVGGQPPVPNVREYGRTHRRPVCTGAENLGFDTQTVQPVDSRYDDDIPGSS